MKQVAVAFGFNNKAIVLWFLDGRETIHRLKCPACQIVLRVSNPNGRKAACGRCETIFEFPKEAWNSKWPLPPPR